ncbi:unnamed protein product [Closterium sp. Naga37s-1]|nr:unnamed protein product [Closterium sp. Naga37s-1]
MYENKEENKSMKRGAAAAALDSVLGAVTACAEKKGKITEFFGDEATCAKEDADNALCLMISALKLPERIVDDPVFRYAVQCFARAGPGYVPPKRGYVGGAGLKKVRQKMEAALAPVAASWKRDGVTVSSDMMTDRCGRPQANILLVNDSGAVFEQAVDCNMESKTGGYIASLLRPVIDKVGPENVVAVCTDGGSNYASAARKIAGTWPHIEHVPCATHVLDLLMEDVGKMGWAKGLVEKGGEMITFVRNHHFTRAYMKKVGGKQVLKPAGTRAAVMDEEWWGVAEFFSSLKAMRATDSSAKGMMGKLYDIMLQLTEDINDKLDASGDFLTRTERADITKIVKDRWDNSLACPMHVVGRILNPANQEEGIFRNDVECTRVFKDYIERHYDHVTFRRGKDGAPRRASLVLQEALLAYINLEGSFGKLSAIAAREAVKKGEMSMVQWWSWHSTEYPELATLACRILTQPVSASSCERGWAQWEGVHTARRNRLGSAKCADLVYIAHNWNVVRNWYNKDGASTVVPGNIPDAPIPRGYNMDEEEEDDLLGGEGDDAVLADEYGEGVVVEKPRKEIGSFLCARLSGHHQVRVIGDTRASFQEDPARCVRAIRLAARLGFRLSTGVTRALKAPSTLPAVATLPQSRMQMELVQMMSHGASEPSIRLLWQFNLLPLLLPLQAQYLRGKKFSQKALTDRPDLMFDLLHELDALVQPDNPCHPSTWLSLLALHLAASDLPNHLRPLALLTAVLAAHPSCPSARIAARVAISFAQSSHPNLCQRLGIQGLAWPSEEKPSLTGEGRREKESRFGPKQQEGQVGEICSDGSIGGGEYVGGGQWATEGSKGMEEEDWEGFREVEWRGEEGMEGMGRGEVARAVRGAVGTLKARREAVLQELAAVEGQLGEVVSEMMLRGGGISRFAARLEEVGEGGGEGKWEGDGEKGETQERKQAIESSGLLLSGEGGKGEAEGGGGAAAQVLTPDLASAVAESLARVRAWGQQWHEEQQMLTDVSRLLVALEGTGGMGAMGAVRTNWGRGGGGGVGVEGSEGDEGKAGEGRGGDDVVAGAEEGSGGDGVSDGGECDSSEGEEGAVSAAADAAGDDAHGSGSQRAARRKKNAWRLTTEEDIIRAASLLAVRASQQVHHMVDDRLLSATLHDLTGLERHDNVFIQYKVAQSTHQLFHEIICKSEVNEDEHALLHLKSKSLQVLEDGLEGCGGDDPLDIEQVKELLSPMKQERFSSIKFDLNEVTSILKSKPVRGSCETGGAVRADVPKSTFDPSMEIDLQQPLAAGGSAGSADVVRLVAAEHQRILNAFRTALESPLPPSQLALPTLAEALQLGGSAGSGGGIGSAATGTTLPKEGKLTAEQNQLLEIGLRSLLQSLVESAAAQGVSVLSYSPTGPPGVPGSSAAVIRLLDVVLHLCEAGRMEGGVVFQLLEDLMDQSPIADCHLVFSYIESKQHVLAKEHILQRGKLVLLRACNQLVRRLSKANDLVFCGRVLMFLAYFFPIAEKSAVNIKGAFNTSNKTDYAREAPQDAGPLLDFKFYTTFWSLQEYFSNPAVALPKWAVFSSHLCTVLDTFEAQPLGTDVDAGAEAGTGAGDEAGAGAGEEGGAEGAGLGAGGAREGGERGAGGAGGVGEAVGEMLGAYSMKYLTSTSLLQLELRDGSFRRQFLVQCLILLEYLMIPGKAEKDDKREAMRAEAREFEARVKKLLRRLPPGGEDFLTSVEHVMRREKHWVAWKKEVCPPFDRPPADLTPRRDPTPKRPRYLMGNKELDRLFRWADKHPDALTDPEQVAVPAFRDFIQPLADDMDPENCIEAEYHRTNDKVFCWRALRLAARSDIEAFNRFGDLGMEGVVPPDMLPDEVRVKLHKGKPKKDSHGDRDAGFVFDLNMDAPDGPPAAAAGAGARSTPGSAGGGGSGRKGRGGEVSAMEVEGERKADGEGEGRASASKKRSRRVEAPLCRCEYAAVIMRVTHSILCARRCRDRSFESLPRRSFSNFNGSVSC